MVSNPKTCCEWAEQGTAAALRHEFCEMPHRGVCAAYAMQIQIGMAHARVHPAGQPPVLYSADEQRNTRMEQR